MVEPSFQKREEYFRQLESWGYEVVFARDGVECLTLLFHHLPSLLILSSGLTKMDEGEVANIAKTDVLTSGIPLMMTQEAGAQLKKFDNIIHDEVLKLPFSKETFEATKKSAESKQGSDKPARKAKLRKAA